MTAVRTKIAVGVFVVAIVLSAGTGSATYAYFSSMGSASGSITTAEEFGYTGDGACIDTDDNWECNPGDIVVTRENVSQFTNASADLIIPKSVGPIVNDSIDITAGGFKTEADLRTQYGDISVTTASDRLQVNDSQVSTDSADITLTANDGDVLVNGSTVTAGSGAIGLSGNAVDGRTAVLETDSTITVGADVVDLTEARVSGDYDPVSLTAIEALVLDGANVTTSGGSITARGQSVSATNTANAPALIETTGTVEVAATRNGGGDLDGTGLEVAGDGTVDLLAAGALNLNGATVDGDYGTVTLDGKRVSAAGATVTTSSDIDVLATRNGGGAISASDLELTGSGQIAVTAAGAVTLDGGVVDPGQRAVSIDGVDVSVVGTSVHTNADVEVSAMARSDGQLDATNATLVNTYGKMTLEATGDVTVDGASVSSNSDITVSADDGTVSAADAVISGQYGSIDLESGGNVVVERATITASNGQASATLGSNSATLFYDALTIADGDDTLTYTPAGANEDGQTASGNVTAG